MRHSTFAAAIAVATLGSLDCDHSPTTPRLDQLALEVVSGDGQTAVVGTQLAPLIVKVTSGGNPVVQQVLNFRVVSGGGSVFGGAELTDNDGIAQELWTLGTNASQPQKVEVRAVESSTGAEKVFGTFSATAIADKAESLFAAAGNYQTAIAGNAVPIPPAVEVTDQYGNPISGISVTFNIASGGGSITAPTTVITGVSGAAAAGGWTIGTTAGANTLTAQSIGLAGSPVTFTALATNGTAARLVAATRQFAGPVGTVLAAGPVLRAVDANGNGVANVAVTFSVLSGGGSLDGVTSLTTLTDPTGAASAAWTLGTTVRSNTIQATAQGLQGSPIVFTAMALAGPAAQIAIQAGNNQTAPPATAVATSPAVLVSDQYNNPVSGVAVAFAVGSGGGSLTGGNQTTDAAGIATVGSWTLGQSAGPNTLMATSNGLAGSPLVFNATATQPTWTTKTSMLTATSGAGFGVIGGKIYFAGGQVANNCAPIQTLEVYDPASDSWTTGAPMPTARWYSAGGVVNGMLYVVGGEGGGCPGPTFQTVEAYDPVANSWTTKAPMPTARYGVAVGVVNGILYAVGGAAHSPSFNTLEAYDPVTNTWMTRASMPTARVYPTVAVVNGILYAIGGLDNSGNYVATVEAYDPGANTWTTRASMPTIRAGSVSGVVQGMIYVAGGYNTAAFLSVVERYDPTSNVWTTQTPMPTVRALSMSGVVNNAVYVVGGQIPGPIFLTTNEAYQP
jgi:N-acetylneuraminic acid mutarotase